MFKCYSEDESRAMLYYYTLVRDFALEVDDFYLTSDRKVYMLRGYIAAIEDTAKDLSDILTYEDDNMGSGDLLIRKLTDLQGVFEAAVVTDYPVRKAFRQEGWIR